MHHQYRRIAAFAACAFAAASAAGAQIDKTPNLGATVPGSWSTDRFAPCQFNLANGVQGRNNALQIGVCQGDYQGAGAFSDYQGMQIGVDPAGTLPAASQVLSLDLYVDPTWATNQSGDVSTSMWSRVNAVNTDAEIDAYYPIIGFSNASGVGEFRFWDSYLGWQDLSATVNYGAWNTLSIGYNTIPGGDVFTAMVNGNAFYSETTNPLDTPVSRISTAFVEDYNYGEAGYTADWSQAPTATPEPASLALLATGLLGLAGVYGRRKRQI